MQQLLLGVLAGAGGCCEYPGPGPFLGEGDLSPEPALEKGLWPGPLSPAASPAHPVLQMEVDGSEGPETQDLPSDGEFEGEGDYEEGFFADWWQEPKTKGDKADQGS